ncbi:MAG: hypothetical protein LAN71_08080 [Acidobacteriia bacterium]|nr:hypothetical protein [Terriglobia bacterium]
MLRLRHILILAGLLALSAFASLSAGRPQRVLDRIAARVEDDVILYSEIRDLAAFQQLAGGKRETDAQLLDRLIDQWIVRSEAEASHYPRPSEAEIDRELESWKKGFSSEAILAQLLADAGWSLADLRGMLAAQLYLTGYLDSRFRPSVQLPPGAVEEFYQASIVSAAQARKETPPPLESVRDSIQEALVQKGINELADRWLKERRERLHVEKELP